MSSIGSLWDASELPDESLHSALRYDDVAASGPPARPLDFPAPSVFSCTKTDILARDHLSGTIHNLKNVLIRSELDNGGRPADVAYLVKKKLGKSVYGTIRLCIVLKRIPPQQIDQTEERQDSILDSQSQEFVEWESTDLKAVVKASEWSKIYAMRGRHLEDPIREVSAMQLLGNYHPNVAGALEVLQDDTCLYAIMPHFPYGDLYGRLVDSRSKRASSENSDETSYMTDEAQARIWFRQLLDALFHLQKKGVCHRDVSLENILLDENDQIVLIDPGMSLRVPYTDPCNYGCVTDVSAGTCRRLMIAQGQGGNLMYAAPEVVEHEEFVDAFAIDLWSAGVVLFIMLVGMAPFKWAHPSDKRYLKIARGGLRDVMAALGIPLSSEAMDLLQGFFWRDPRKRLTLAEVMDHPWVNGERFVNASLTRNKSQRNRDNYETVQAPNMCESRRVKFPREMRLNRLVEPNF